VSPGSSRRRRNPYYHPDSGDCRSPPRREQPCLYCVSESAAAGCLHLHERRHRRSPGGGTLRSATRSATRASTRACALGMRSALRPPSMITPNRRTGVVGRVDRSGSVAETGIPPFQDAPDRPVALCPATSQEARSTPAIARRSPGSSGSSCGAPPSRRPLHGSRRAAAGRAELCCLHGRCLIPLARVVVPAVGRRAPAALRGQRPGRAVRVVRQSLTARASLHRTFRLV
jgi:hypothetical protein